MSIRIPSANIFSIENEKVVKKSSYGVSSKPFDVVLNEKEFFNISFSPYIENSHSLLFKNFVYYTSNINSVLGGDINISFSSKNNVYYYTLMININSENYIDIKSISGRVSVSYKRGEAYQDGAIQPSFLSNSNLTDVITTEKTTLNLGKNTTLVYGKSFPNEEGKYFSTPSLYSLMTCSPSHTSSISKSKNVTVFVEIPAYYQPNGSSQSGATDSIVITGINLSISGKEIAFLEKEKTFGESPYYELPQNEFFQDLNEQNSIDDQATGSYITLDGEKVSLIDAVSKKIIEEYKDGKEIAKIRCSISEYGSNINPNNKLYPMSFNIGDEVIPMVFGGDGTDHAMSKYKDGSDKVFHVCGIKFIYDGAVWQELTLQEINKKG